LLVDPLLLQQIDNASHIRRGHDFKSHQMFLENLSKKLVETHHAFDPSEPSNYNRVIMHFLTSSWGN
jgi:hypothetical protein